ncbi:MAG TPA: hypothetical protein VGR03_05500 [Candidatus Acidoferrum sp.]|nr:hypothetical protein [Candidatus Acidoferrum sp.]
MSAPRSKDRTRLCVFTFADGRKCRTPRQPAVAGQPGHPHLCFYHARKEAQARAADQVGREISSSLTSSYLSACDLNSALARLFAAVAQGHVKPRTAATLAYLGQTLVQTIPLAQDEYINAFGTDGWREAVRSSFPGQPYEDEDQVLDGADHPELPAGAKLSSPSDSALLTSLESTLAKLYQNK